MKINDRVKVVLGQYSGQIGYICSIINGHYNVQFINVNNSSTHSFTKHQLTPYMVTIKMTKGQYAGSLGLLTNSALIGNRYRYDVTLNSVRRNGLSTIGKVYLSLTSEDFEYLDKNTSSSLTSSINKQLEELWS